MVAGRTCMLALYVSPGKGRVLARLRRAGEIVRAIEVQPASIFVN